MSARSCMNVWLKTRQRWLEESWKLPSTIILERSYWISFSAREHANGPRMLHVVWQHLCEMSQHLSRYVLTTLSHPPCHHQEHYGISGLLKLPWMKLFSRETKFRGFYKISWREISRLLWVGWGFGCTGGWLRWPPSVQSSWTVSRDTGPCPRCL